MARTSNRQEDGSVGATLNMSAFESLRADILQGAIAPGEKLRIEALKERYGMGASPLREALNRLSALHLVEKIDQRGFRVALVSHETLVELAMTRCWVSEIAIRESIYAGNAAWEESVVLAHHRLKRHHETSTGPDREWEVLHRQFHFALIAACPSHWLREFHETLFDLADRSRHMAVLHDHATRDVAGEHQRIVDAVIGRDVTGAVSLLNQHFRITADIAIASIEPQPLPDPVD
jgi:GntR family transcriptional regulator, carbon starvation induced regulator